ncbi:undecaprenyl-diphosphate phosphatase [Candidatus Gracilibacteria bacterium]|nr:undecaprenyl-diphosphate phosphatase [Candidatus Gracilibacteria bacterium]
MEFIQSIFLGILQGFTEFLPISSSGHLFLAEEFLGLVPDLHFEISLHVASLVAVLIIFRHRIWSILRGLGSTCLICVGDKKEGVLGWKLFVASLTTVPVALLLKSQFEFFRTVEMVGITLIITGILIFFSEKFRPEKIRDFSWWIVVILGLVQGIAVLPGISRAGVTISFLILLGINRKHAAEISFLLAIPTIIGALVFSLGEGGFMFSSAQFIGCLASLVAAILAIKWMMKLVQKNWIWFAPYCVVAGIVVSLLV